MAWGQTRVQHISLVTTHCAHFVTALDRRDCNCISAGATRCCTWCAWRNRPRCRRSSGSRRSSSSSRRSNSHSRRLRRRTPTAGQGQGRGPRQAAAATAPRAAPRRRPGTRHSSTVANAGRCGTAPGHASWRTGPNTSQCANPLRRPLSQLQRPHRQLLPAKLPSLYVIRYSNLNAFASALS